MIAWFETTHPGAIFVGMGRDLVMTVDIMDAYYRSIGQPGRALRLNGSGETIRGAPLDQLASFMKSEGIDLDHKKNQRYVLVDNSYYEVESQIFRLMGAAYQYNQDRGIPPQNYLKKLSPINTYHSNSTMAGTATEVHEKLLNSLSTTNLTSTPLPVMSIHPPVQLTKGVSFYTREWHGSFGKLMQTPDGLTKATSPTSQASSESKAQILHEMFSIMNFVKTLQFREMINSISAQHGYTYKAPAPSPICHKVYRSN